MRQRTGLAASRPATSLDHLVGAIPTPNVAQAGQEAINPGLAEEGIPLNPDLVIAGRYTARAAVALLKRVGVPTMDVDVPRTFDEVRQQYREVAAILGEQARGERVIADMDDRLDGLARERPSARLRATVLNPNGLTVGRGSVGDEIITRAGVDKVAATLGLGEDDEIPLEIVAMNAIDVQIVSSRAMGHGDGDESSGIPCTPDGEPGGLRCQPALELRRPGSRRVGRLTRRQDAREGPRMTAAAASGTRSRQRVPPYAVVVAGCRSSLSFFLVPRWPSAICR